MRLRGRGYAPDRKVALLLPALVLLSLGFLWPVAHILWQSVSEPTLGLQNYRQFFETPAYVTILRRTFTTAVIVTVVCVALAYPYAYLMTLVSTRWRLVLVAIVLVPFWTSLMVRTYAWIVLLQNTGIINDGLVALGLARLPLIRNTLGVTIGMAQILFPFVVLPLYSAMRGIDRRLLQAAQGLGASPSQAFRKVFLPLSMPGVTAGATLAFVLSLGFYVAPSLLGSPQNALLSQLVVQQISRLLDFGMGGAMGAILLVATLLLMLVTSRLAGRISGFTGLGGGPR